MNTRTRFPNKGRRLGRLIVSSCVQSGGAPWFDSARTVDVDGNEYRSVAVKPSLKSKRDRGMGRALVLGWRSGESS